LCRAPSPFTHGDLLREPRILHTKLPICQTADGTQIKQIILYINQTKVVPDGTLDLWKFPFAKKHRRWKTTVLNMFEQYNLTLQC